MKPNAQYINPSGHADGRDIDNTTAGQKIEEMISAICLFHDNESLLSQALKHHFRSGGSRTRAKLTYKFARHFMITPQDAIVLACIPELLHNASLIHDDLQDQDEDRRDECSVWKKFGSDIAICAGDFLISAAYSCVAKIKSQYTGYILTYTHNYVHDVINGQIEDLSQGRNHSLSNVDLYQDICMKKSGPLLAMSLNIPLIYTGQYDYLKAVETVFYPYAVAYQIYDDITDIDRDQSKKGKGAGLNIVTIMQRNNDNNPLASAIKLAQHNLSNSERHIPKLPGDCRSTLVTEIAKMKQKIVALEINE